MSYKTISVVITDKATDSAALAAAAALVLAHDGHLDVTCLGVDSTRFDALPMGANAMVLDVAQTEARERAQALKTWAEGALPVGLVQATVQDLVVSNLGLDAAIARMTRYADLVVAGQPYGPGRSILQTAAVEASLFGTPAPVLVVPDRARDYARPFGRVMVAWDDSDEALTAARGALPMLQAAGHVDVVLIDPPAHSPERSDPGGALCLMLTRHGIRTEVSILSRTMPRTAEVMMRFAREHGVDAVVMGAYGHSRFREAILGGATRDMLQAAELPLLMAH
jgi:nucleotide-binding universal stress UspA family protein